MSDDRDDMHRPAPAEMDPIAVPRSRAARLGLIVLGWLMVALGVVGVLMPVVPSAPFLLVALWAFSKSSRRFHDWLYHHPVFGPPLREFRAYRVVPWHAKAAAGLGMAGSATYVIGFTAAPWYAVALMIAVMLAVLGYLMTCPSRRPADADVI